MERCILCDSRNYNKLFASSGYDIIKCNKCGLVKTSGRRPEGPIDVENYHRDEDYKKFEEHFKNIFKKRFNIISKFITTPGVVMDIGASTGAMLDVFKDRGWETWGVEPSRVASIAKKKGHKIFHTTFEKAKLPHNFFDVVILNHTLEHLKDPLLVLKKLEKILKNSGLVLVDVPNFDSLSSKVMKGKWKLLLPQEHVHHFTFTSLLKLLKKAGFKVIFSKSRSGMFEFANPAREFFDSLFTLKKRFFTNILRFPVDTIETFLNKGQSVSMVGLRRR